jgi:competence protein ComEA
MISTRLLAGAAAIMMAAGPVLAQTAQPVAPTAPARPAAPAAAQPTAPARPAAPVAAPAAPAAARPAAAPAATTPVGKIVNINTASAQELDTLKGIGPARAKKIMEERAKTRFRNFEDLVQRNVLPANVEADLRGKISF